MSDYPRNDSHGQIINHADSFTSSVSWFKPNPNTGTDRNNSSTIQTQIEIQIWIQLVILHYAPNLEE